MPPLSCPHHPTCPACPRLGEAGLAPGARAALEALAREAGCELAPVEEGAPRGFRHRARLMVRGRRDAPRIGLFQLASHRIVATPRCPIHHPHINRVTATVRELMRELRIAPYADAPHRGLLRALQVVVERPSQRAQLVLVTCATDAEAIVPLSDALQARLGDTLHSVWWNGQPERSNVILGPHWQRLLGPEAVVEESDGARLFYPPGAFGQSHLALAERLAARARSWVPDGARVTELYAGVGAIAMPLLTRVAELRLNELSLHGLRGLELGLADRPAAERARARVFPGPAGLALDALKDADAVIVDPPRRGLDAELLEALCQAPPARLVYLSCGLPSLLREWPRLRDAGLALAVLVPFALFPYTEHVETALLFERR